MNDEDLLLTLPTAALDPIDCVLVLDFPAQISADKAIRLAPDAPTWLHVMDGRLDGQGIRYGDGKTTRDVVEEWSRPEAKVTWVVRVPQSGRFTVNAEYNTHGAENLGVFLVQAAQQELTGHVTPTPNLATFRSDMLGELVLPAGEYTLVVRPKLIAGGNLMRLRQLKLTPVAFE
jgi:hypothetical protein